jgi:hypothetical protein
MVMFEIKNTNTGEIIEIAENDFEKPLDWWQANEFCKKLGHKYRLPKRSEFEQMHKELFLNGRGNFNSKFYWCTENDESTALIFNITEGKFDPNVSGEYFAWEKSDHEAVRAVCTI